MQLKLGEEKLKEIATFLYSRFAYLDELKSTIAEDVEEDIQVYNNKDKFQDEKKDWEYKEYIPYTYTIVQTMVARLIESLFDGDNYIKAYGESPLTLKIEKEFTRWIQAELDKIKLKARARDFLEDSLIQRVNWLELRPLFESNKMTAVDFNVLSFFDVWWDTNAENVEDTDMFVRKVVKLYRMMQNDKVYFNLDQIKSTIPPDDIKKRQTYEAKNGQAYYEPVSNSVTDEVELLEWHGDYDISEDPKKPNFQPVIFVWANRSVLVRVETVELKTRKKKLIFPIRPMRQARSLIGKSVPQLTKNQQYELNEIRALRMTNFRLLTKLLFKYKKNGSVDLSELFADGGNAIGWDDSPQDIDTFNVPNMLKEASFMGQEVIQDMQQVTGAVDYVMGTSAARGTTETASGIKQITDQAMFKFGMMAANVYDDLMEFINFIVIMQMKYNKKEILNTYPKFADFFNAMDEEKLEESRYVDITIHNLSERRDIERSQVINAMNIILPMIQQSGGNVQEFIRYVLDQFDIVNIDDILSPPPQEKQFMELILGAVRKNPMLGQFIQMLATNPQAFQQVIASLQQAQPQGGSQGIPPSSPESGAVGPANPQQVKEGMPEQSAQNPIPGGPPA